MTPEDSIRKQRSSRLWGYAGALALAGLLCSVLLGGLSAWFLGSVALAGLGAAAYAFNFHTPAAFVRLFAMGRTATRYGERLFGHEAAMTDQARHRIALFDAMAAAPSVRAAGWQLADQARLADYMDDVEDIDFARLRSDLPSALLAVGLAGAASATVFVAPLALLPIGVLVSVVAAVIWRVMDLGAGLWGQVRERNRAAADSLGLVLGSVVPLQAERDWSRRCEAALQGFSRADRHLMELRRAQATLDALASVFGPVAATSVVGAAWLGGAKAGDLLIPIFLAFSWIALGEAAQGISRIVVAAMRRQAAKREMARWTERPSVVTKPMRSPPPLISLRSIAFQRRAPDDRLLGQQFAVAFEVGRPTVLIGASGTGKTSLLKQVAGWIGDDTLQGSDGPLPAPERRSLAMLCPHDAAILTDTVRANLFAASADDADLWAALEAVELVERVEAAGGLDGWIAQDMVSLGEAQRFNLARAWLSTKPLILLDEPAEHLDSCQADRILSRILERLCNKIIIIANHRSIIINNNTVVVDLDRI